MSIKDLKDLAREFTDVTMTVLLLCLMAYQVTGESMHEWVGIGMTVLLILHHILNVRWYAVLFKGKYSAFRIVSTAADMLLLLTIVLTAFTGMSMSHHAVPFLYGMTGMVFARTVHLALSYWSFLLTGLHLGLHLPAMTGKIRPDRVWKAVLTVLFTVLAGTGFWIFLRNGIPEYIFFRTHFAFLDYDKAGVLVFLENLAIGSFFAFLGANIVRFLRSLNRNVQNKKKALIPVACVLAALILGVGVYVLTAQNGIG